ncbi:MAG: hypothetical protein LBU64_10905 [Planctomycetota bacterium]|nr:hypothetical protein [Planctomycetota bacterium]
MGNSFDFLKNGKAAAIFRLLESLPLADAALVLVELPAALGVQVMAYFPRERHSGLLREMRLARRETDPSRAVGVAGQLRRRLLEAKEKQSSRSQQLRSWVPRPATGSPINGPPLPGKPPPVAGDPLESPLGKSGWLEMIARSREKFFPGGSPSDPAAKRSLPAGRPGSRLGRSGGAGTPAIPPKAPPAARRPEAEGEVRRLDGKAILAAILRQADPGVRENIRRSDPALYREIKDRMFYFDDLMLTDDASLALVFTAAPVNASALALRFSAPAFRDRVLRSVGPGRARALRETPAGRPGLDAVEAAQKEVLAVALKLQAAGRMLIDPDEPDLA